MGELVLRHDITKQQTYMKELDDHLWVSGKPAASAMMLLRKIRHGAPLGQPPFPTAGSFAYKQKGRPGQDSTHNRHRDSDRNERDRRDRDRSRSRDRDRRERDRS